jgi:hypothetical protein
MAAMGQSLTANGVQASAADSVGVATTNMSDEQHARRRPSSAFGVLPSLDPTLVGWHPSPKDQAVLDTVLPGPSLVQSHSTLFGAAPSEPSMSPHSAYERTWRVLAQLPMHWLKTICTCMLCAVAGTVPILVAGLHAKRMVADLPHVTATYRELEHLSEIRSGTSLALEAVKSAFVLIITTVQAGARLYSLVAHRVVWPSIRVVYPLCMLCLIAAGQLTIFTPPAAGSTFFWNYWLPIFYLIAYIMIVTPLRSIGRRVGDSTFWWKIIIWSRALDHVKRRLRRLCKAVAETGNEHFRGAATTHFGWSHCDRQETSSQRTPTRSSTGWPHRS